MRLCARLGSGVWSFDRKKNIERMRLIGCAAGGNPLKEDNMETKERIQLLKEQLANIGVHNEAELQKKLEETKLDITVFVANPDSGRKSA